MSSVTSISVAEIAQRVAGELEGDGKRLILDIATLETATSSCLSWVGSADHLHRAEASGAGVILIPDDCSLSADHTVIRVSDPDSALCDVLELLSLPRDPVARGIHPTATVASEAMVEGAAIGPNVVVGRGVRVGSGTQLCAGVYVGANTTIGCDCCVWPNVVIREHTTIGDRVVIHPNASIGADGFGYLHRDGRHKKIPQIGRVVLEDDVEIGAGSAVDRARSGVTRIGRGTKIDNLVQIGHNVRIGEHCIIIACCGIGGSATIGNDVVIAGNVSVTDHVTLGDGVRVAACSLVTGDVAAGNVVRGTPAIDQLQFGRQQVSLRKLPGWMKKLRDLVRRVDRLEE